VTVATRTRRGTTRGTTSAAAARSKSGAAVSPRHPAVVALSTAGSREEAERIATALVDERLAACVNRLPGVESTYRWNGAVQVDEEVLLVIKTSRARYEALEARVVALHPYEVPEVIAIPIEGHAPYLAWIAKETRPE